MPARRIGGRVYEEIAVRAVEPLPVDIGGGSISISGGVTIDTVTIDNTNANPVPVTDAGGTLSIDDGGGSITVDGPLTDGQLRASAIPVSLSTAPLPSGAATATLQTSGNATLTSVDGKLPALVGARIPVDASGVSISVNDGGSTVSVDDGGGSITVDGPLTDTQLRATAVPVSDGGGSITVDGPLTDTQLRATSVPVSDGGGSITVDGTVAVSGTVTTGVAQRTPTTASVASSAVSQLMQAQNSSRKGIGFSNISTSKLYLSFSDPASIANCFIELQPGAFLLFDQQLIAGNAIYGIWASANGACQVTEFV